MIYIYTFFITLLISSVFSLAGVGGAAAIIPVINMMGFPFTLSKAVGLFVNFSATATSSYMNIKRKALDIKFTLPILFTLLFSLPIGAYISQYFDIKLMKILLSLFLFISATLILTGKRKFLKLNSVYPIVISVFVIGIISGIIGISGGNLIIALLAILGYNPKKIAISISFIVPFASLAAFLTYTTFIKIDYYLLFSTATGAIIGGFIGNKIMFYNLNEKTIKKIIAFLMYLVALKFCANIL